MVRSADGVKLVWRNNEPCLAVLANFLAPIVQLAATGKEFKERKSKGCDLADRVG